MHLNKGFSLAPKFLPLVFIAVMLDLLQLGDILRRAQDFSIKFTIPSAIPSLTQVLTEPQQAAGGFNVNIPFGYMGGAAVLMFIIFLLLSSFLKGGFLGSVLLGLRGESFSMNNFIGYGKEFFARFLLQFVAIFIVILAFIPFAFILGPLALVLLALFFVLFFLLIFWDYIIVVENTDIIDGAKKSWNLVSNNLGNIFSFVIPIALFAALFSIIANLMVAASPILAVIASIVYAYLGTAVIFAMMSFYMEIIEGEKWSA